VLFFDQHGRCIIKRDKLENSFIKQLYEIYKEHNLRPLEITDGNLTYNCHVIMKYSDKEGIQPFCMNFQYNKSLIIYKRIEEFCNVFCKKNNLKK